LVGAFSPPGLEIELATAADIEARVEFLGGRLAPAAVRFATRPEIQALRWSQSGGGYRVRGVPPELMVALAAVAPGFAPGVANIPHQRPRTRSLSATDEQIAKEPAVPFLPRVAVLTLVPTFALQVQVVDDEMRPLPGVRVAFAPRRPERWRAVPGTDWPDFVRGADLGLTGADGLVEAEGLWDTEVVFTASRHDRGAVHLKKDALSPGERIVIRLPALARITGNIVADGAAVSRRYRVQLAMPPATEVAQLHPVRDPVEVVSDDEGGFELPRIGAGDWILEVLEPRLPRQGYGQPDLSASRKHLTQPLAVEPGTHVDLTLDLSKSQRTATVVGRFSLGGVPAAGVRVELWDERPFVVPGQSIGHRAQRIAATWTDAQGGFSFDERWRRSGQVRVFVARHGKQVQFAEVELRTEERRSRRTEPVLIDVPIGDLALELRGADHLPLARRPLRLVGPGGVVLPVVADDEGQVRESGLPAGAYRIVATGPVGKLLDFGEPVVVAAGETTTTWREAGR
jgi:hypothetical protein